MVENDSKKIYSLTYSFVIFTSFLALFIGEGTHLMYNEGKNDTLISAIIGFVLSFALFSITKWIINKNEKEDLFELNKSVFGKTFGNILNIVLWIGFFIVATVILYSLADFFNTEYLPETSINYLKALVLLPIVYVATKELPTIIKGNQILSLISLGLIIFCFIGITDSFEIGNIEPLLNTSKASMSKNILTYFILSSLPLSMLLITSKKNIKDSERLNKNILKLFILSNVCVIAIIIGTILTLGMEYIEIFRFPEYIALKQFSLFNILERIENILAMQYFFNNFGLLSLLFYFLIKLIPKTKFKNYYSILVGIVQIVITDIFFNNTITFLEYVRKYFVWVIGICILIPILLVFFKMLQKSKSNA
ncbi:MAG: GerAB/ArcD/ProY family transporter [Clostridia bacterium]|nr:GerAB/ArcD/ProY family transporter [Clostridia bacterium]